LYAVKENKICSKVFKWQFPHRHRGEDAEATEATRLEAGLAGLKVGDRAVAALDEADLLPEKYKTRCTRI